MGLSSLRSVKRDDRRGFTAYCLLIARRLAPLWGAGPRVPAGDLSRATGRGSRSRLPTRRSRSLARGASLRIKPLGTPLPRHISARMRPDRAAPPAPRTASTCPFLLLASTQAQRSTLVNRTWAVRGRGVVLVRGSASCACLKSTKCRETLRHWTVGVVRLRGLACRKARLCQNRTPWSPPV